MSYSPTLNVSIDHDRCIYADHSGQATWKDFLSLTKPGVMSLVVFTGLCGALMAPGQIHIFNLIVSLICIALASGASGAINMWYDRDIDALMKRTALRAIPSGKIAPRDALTFGIVLAITSCALMVYAAGITATLLLILSMFIYVYVYTFVLKRKTPQNIVIGGAAGALPPMIGWAIVTGEVHVNSFIMFLIIFLWTPPHFWALAIHQTEAYAKAKIPMLPVCQGATVTYQQIILYSILMAGTACLPFVMEDFAGHIYAYGAVPLNAIFVLGSFVIWKMPSKKRAFQFFWYSIFYLFALFALLLIDHFNISAL